MAIEAPLSRYKKNNIWIFIAVLLACAGWFAYDGYLNAGFIEKHTDIEGTPDSTLAFNRKAPPFFAAAAAAAAAYFLAIRNRKIVAGENELVINGTERIPYDSIEKIDKTYLEKKGYFAVTYKNTDGTRIDRKLRDTTYDNLRTLLDYLVAKIT